MDRRGTAHVRPWDRWRSWSAASLAAMLLVAVMPSDAALAAVDGPPALDLASVGPERELGDQASGPNGLALSGDGTTVAFATQASTLHPADDDRVLDVYVKRLTDGALLLASTSRDGVKGDDLSGRPSLSADGRLVTFHSAAMNLHPIDTNDGRHDIYVKDFRGPRG